MIATTFTQVFKGVEYTLTYQGWADLTGISQGTIYGRYKKWQKGIFPEKDILFQGLLDSNSRPKILKHEISQIDYSWVYRRENWITAKLKWHYLSIEPSAYMNQVRQ